MQWGAAMTAKEQTWAEWLQQARAKISQVGSDWQQAETLGQTPPGPTLPDNGERLSGTVDDANTEVERG